MHIEFGLKFVIAATAGKYGIAVVAVDHDGKALGAPAPLIDSIYTHPSEAADVLLGTLRGAVTNRRPAFQRDELGIGAALAAKA